MHNLNKLFFNVFYNSSLFLILLIGIQNSSNKVKVNLLIDETIRLPISFIIGTSFISGSIFGSLLKLSTTKNIAQS
tara:strand:+ start:631 stop:858 length:228 start_codon:yes stop_codon:yes gene_type:complete